MAPMGTPGPNESATPRTASQHSAEKNFHSGPPTDAVDALDHCSATCATSSAGPAGLVVRLYVPSPEYRRTRDAYAGAVAISAEAFARFETVNCMLLWPLQGHVECGVFILLHLSHGARTCREIRARKGRGAA